MALSTVPYISVSSFSLDNKFVERKYNAKIEFLKQRLGELRLYSFSSYPSNASKINSRKLHCLASKKEDNGNSQNALPTDAEKEGWEKRQSEAGQENKQEFGSWKWTLNWNSVTPQIIIGSCPRSPSDIDRMIDEAGVTSILNLQCDLCFEALNIPFDDIRARASERAAYINRVPIRDFDHGDQTMMLPEAVRRLNSLVTRGNKVYVHCTAGINRASLTVVGYLTFVKGLSLEEAVEIVKTARPVAHPYIDCWTSVKKKLLEGRDEELTALAAMTYKERCAGGVHGTASTDWATAQAIAMSRTFQRWLEVDLDALMVERELAQREAVPSLAIAQNALAEAHKVLAKAFRETTKGASVIREEESLLQNSTKDAKANGVSVNATVF